MARGEQMHPFEMESVLKCKLRPGNEYFNHKHPLALIVGAEGEGKHYRCYNCNNRFFHDQLFGCSQCQIFVHQSCARYGLVLKIRHPFHPPHPLALRFYSVGGAQYYVRCYVCDKSYEPPIFFFNCKDCQFELCKECLFRAPDISLAGHQHRLAFFYKLYSKNPCSSCKQGCDHLVFKCASCYLNFHLSCFPWLPKTIKDKCHIDPLTLITDPDLVESDKGCDEFYCDACEEKRDPKDAVYYCSTCPFVAHVECVLSTVLSLVRTEEKDAEFKPLENYLADLTGDEAMARDFFAKLRSETETDGEETEVTKHKTSSLVTALDEQIEQLYEDISRETKIFEEVKANLKALNERLERLKGQRAKLLCVQHQM